MIKQIALHLHSASSSFAKSTADEIDGATSANFQPVFDRLDALDHKVEEVLALVSGTTKSLYTVEEVARLTGRSPYTVRRWISEQRISATRIADTGPRGRLLIARAELQRLIELGQGDSIPAAACDRVNHI